MNNFFLYGGSLIPIAILVYCFYVMKAVKLFKITSPEFDLPNVFLHHSSEWFILAALPSLVFSAIYVWLFAGLSASIFSFFALMFVGKWGGMILGFYSTKFIGYHYMIACILLPIGYYIFFVAIWNITMLILKNT